MHAGNGGLQQHSIGVQYPWTIRIVGNNIQAFHCITAEQRQFHSYNPDVPGSFADAHAKAERDCEVPNGIVLEVLNLTSKLNHEGINTDQLARRLAA